MLVEKPAPVSEASRLKQSGLNDGQVVRSLEQSGYSQRQIADAMSQLNIKQGVASSNEMKPSLLDEDIPVPSPPSEESVSAEIMSSAPAMQFSQMYGTNLQPGSDVEELVESVVEEKWNRFADMMTEMEIWKARMNDDVMSIKQEVLRLGKRLDMLQTSVIGRVDEYSQSVRDMGSEMKALEKVFQNIMQPLASNIKELSRITDEMKGVKK